MNSKLTENTLLELGFNKYKPSEFDSDAVDACYQKCVKDEKGKKYFIDVKHYILVHPHTREDLSGYEISTQLYRKGTHNAINLTFLHDDLEDAQKFIEELFDESKLDYYEEF